MSICRVKEAGQKIKCKLRVCKEYIENSRKCKLVQNDRLWIRAAQVLGPGAEGERAGDKGAPSCHPRWAWTLVPLKLFTIKAYSLLCISCIAIKLLTQIKF